MRRTWSEAQRREFVRLYPVTDTRALAERLGRSYTSIRSQAKNYGLRKANDGRRPWTNRERALLCRLYPNTPTKEIALQLGRTVTTTYQVALKMGLRKSAAYLASPASGRLRRGSHPNSVKHRFKPGHASWNKGRPGSETGTGTHPNSRRTQFRKGRKPEESRNYRPIGSLRICADGYLERKVTDDQRPVPARRWVAVHRLVWEAAHGPVPAGHIVTFKPGMRSTTENEITLDRLELLTLAENMRRNTLHRYPKEIARLIQLRGALNRQINKRSKAA